MIYLLSEIWPCVLGAAALGAAGGWLVWGHQLARARHRYSHKLGRVTRDWQAVEERLTSALVQVRALEVDVQELTREREELDTRLRAANRG